MGRPMLHAMHRALDIDLDPVPLELWLDSHAAIAGQDAVCPYRAAQQRTKLYVHEINSEGLTAPRTS